jgi:hypothetical protein
MDFPVFARAAIIPTDKMVLPDPPRKAAIINLGIFICGIGVRRRNPKYEIERIYRIWEKRLFSD